MDRPHRRDRGGTGPGVLIAPRQLGATIAAILSSVVILGRQLQAMVNTIYGDGVVIEDLALVDEIPDAPTDAPVIG